jgi:hypothetical protein
VTQTAAVSPHDESVEGQSQSAESAELPGDLALIAPISGHTWLGHFGGEELVAVRPVLVPTDATDHAPMDLDFAGSLVGWRPPALVPLLGVAPADGRMWLVSELDCGVPLRRFLQVARLSAPQATVIAVDVLTALVTLHEAGHVHTRIHADNVHIGPSGEARLGDWAPAAVVRREMSAELQQADLVAAAALLGLLAGAVHPSSRPLDHCGTRLLDALEQAASANALVDAGPRAVAARLEADLGDTDRQAAVRRELSALVAATPRSGKVLPTRGPIVPDTVLPTTGAAVSTKPPHISEGMRATLRGASRLIAALVVLAALVGTEVGILRGRITHDLRVIVGNQPASNSHPAVPPRHLPGPVPVFAPLAAGPIVTVDVRPLHPCTAGSACTVRVLVQLLPAGRQLRVGWTFNIVDRCSGAVVTQPGGEAVAQPGSDTVVGLGSPTLPRGRSIAVIAVTASPHAASPPLPVPANAGSC